MQTIELDEAAARAFNSIRDHARAKNLSIDEYICQLQATASLDTCRVRPEILRPENLGAFLKELGKAPDGTPVLPRDFSRDDIYSDRY